MKWYQYYPHNSSDYIKIKENSELIENWPDKNKIRMVDMISNPSWLSSLSIYKYIYVYILSSSFSKKKKKTS